MTESEGKDSFAQVLAEYQRLVSARLSQALNSNHPPLLYEPVEYVLAGGGKRVRPTLLILSCKALGGTLESCLDAAVAIELLHNFTLVHDDIMDQDTIRRGRPTVHTKWNSDVAILAGDALFGLAYKALLRTECSQLQRIARVFTDAVMELCEGQALDSDFESRPDVRLSDYLLMIGKKTARLLSVSAEIGAIIADSQEKHIDAMKDFGFNMGCAFQIQDDLLDITSDEGTFGKSFGSDVRRRKQTFLLVHALAESKNSKRKRLDELLKRPNIERSDIIEVKHFFEEIGSIAAAESAVDDYLTSAKMNLTSIPSSPAKGDLESLLDYLWNRKN
ncbi:polyprenyl synthetase family protein [bacterium]|nr:polyprenyl synthetase family protein [bacterium]